MVRAGAGPPPDATSSEPIEVQAPSTSLQMSWRGKSWILGQSVHARIDTPPTERVDL